jgi:hypothetical protein
MAKEKISVRASLHESSNEKFSMRTEHEAGSEQAAISENCGWARTVHMMA